MARTANPAEASAAAPASEPVHTSAQPTNTPVAKPQHHLPTALPLRDEYTGKGGDYARDPISGVRTRVSPPAPAAPAAD